jgi:hypothetical protein
MEEDSNSMEIIQNDPFDYLDYSLDDMQVDTQHPQHGNQCPNAPRKPKPQSRIVPGYTLSRKLVF